MLKKFSVLFFTLIVFAGVHTHGKIFAQATVQRAVRISNASGNYLTMQTAIGAQTFTLTLPQTINPSLTTGSILYALGSGNLNWTSASGAADGWMLTLKTSGSDLIPTWVDPSSLFGNDWTLSGNAISSAWNGSSGNLIGTTNAQPLVMGTTNTATPQPIEFYTNNAEKMRLSSAGNLGIGTNNPSQLLQVNNGNLLLSNSGSAGGLSG